MAADSSVRKMGMRVRRAELEDAPAIALIYAEGIRAGTATVLTEPPTPAEIAERMRSKLPQHTWLVAEESGVVAGWAATAPYLLVPEYAGVAEFSVYVASERQGCGAGRLLMTALMACAQESGLYKMTSRVFAANIASRAMLRAVGFREVGTYARHARVGGEWRDVVIVEVLLGDARLDPS